MKHFVITFETPEGKENIFWSGDDFSNLGTTIKELGFSYTKICIFTEVNEKYVKEREGLLLEFKEATGCSIDEAIVTGKYTTLEDLKKELQIWKNEENPNKYYEVSDGFCTYYVNAETGEKKFKLDESDTIVERNQDDFSR